MMSQKAIKNDHLIQEKTTPQTTSGFSRKSPGYGSSFLDHSKYSFSTVASSFQINTSPQPIQRQTPPGATTTGMTRTQFEQMVSRRFGVQQVATGTFQDQMRMVTRNGIQPTGDLQQSTWQPWNPGANSPVYDHIIQSFDAFSAGMGGLPPVRNITFFDMCYERVDSPTAEDPNRVVTVRKPNAGADYGAGSLNIYRVATTANVSLPAGRSTTAPGAQRPTATQEQTIRRIITHELGHGMQEAAHTPFADGRPALDPTMTRDYARAVGWSATSPPRLYDMGVEAVRTALNSGTTPDAQYRITVDNWNDPRWIEQPISRYMVQQSAFEDFPEAIMTYVDDPNLLRARSPRRYEFIDSRKSRWQSNLVQPRP